MKAHSAKQTRRHRSVGFIRPCLPSHAQLPPSGADRVHEIKHDGFRIMARRDGTGVRLYTRNGYNFSDRFPRIVEASCSTFTMTVDGATIFEDACAFGCEGIAPRV